MQSMQRSFGRLINKGPGNNAKVSIILKDYEDADKVLAKVGGMTIICSLALTFSRSLTVASHGAILGYLLSIRNLPLFSSTKVFTILYKAQPMATAKTSW